MTDFADQVQKLARGVLISLALGLGIVVGVAALGTGAYFAWQWWTFDRHVSRLAVTVKIDTAKECSDADLLRIELFNGSTRTIEWTTLELSAKRPGRSSDIGDVSETTDVLIPPAKRLWACAVPKAKASAGDGSAPPWGVRSFTVRFADD